MTKQITIAIHFCQECPRFNDEDCTCDEDRKAIDDEFQIPEWCPLEDL